MLVPIYLFSFSIKQAEQLQSRMHSDIHEMNKPLARYEDDEDRDSLLKAHEREGDPMLAFLKKKKSKATVKKGMCFQMKYYCPFECYKKTEQGRMDFMEKWDG